MFKLRSLALGLALASGAASAGDYAQYEVTITNLTPGQSFTPQLVVTHPSDISLFTSGQPAGEALEILAEGGDTGPLTSAVAGLADDAQTIGGLLGPGQSASIVVNGQPGRGVFSVAAMMIPTNDTFVALNSVRLPRRGETSHTAVAYDAGTEYNDQNCANIPGPQCGGAGEGYSPGPNEGDEGFVHVSNGIHDLGEDDGEGNAIIGPKVYDWRNPVARITVKRMN